MMLWAGITTACLVAAQPVLADRPTACTPLYSFQLDNCLVEHVMRCETPEFLTAMPIGEPEVRLPRAEIGDRLMRHVFVDPGRPEVETLYTADYAILERFDTAGEIHLSMMPPPFTSKKDPASVAGLLASGRDSVEFHTLGILVPTEPARLRRHRYTAEYTLTGTVETPSGVTLRTGRVEEVFVNMSALLQVSPKFTGTIFVEPEAGVLVFGSRELIRSEEDDPDLSR